MLKPPSGPHELIVVGGTAGCGCTCRHPAAVINAIAASVTGNFRTFTSRSARRYDAVGCRRIILDAIDERIEELAARLTVIRDQARPRISDVVLLAERISAINR